MARVDHEAVLTELTGWIATATADGGRPKTGFGRSELLEKLAELGVKHQVPESLIDRAVRVFGLPLLARAAPALLNTETPATGPSGGRAELEPDKDDDPGPSTAERSHDGSSSSRVAAAA